MKSNNQNSDDDMGFKRLISESEFNDSVDENHQRELRLRALQVFQQAQLASPGEKSVRGNGLAKQSSKKSRGVRGAAFAFAATVAVCLFTVTSLWFSSTGDGPVNGIAERLSAEPEFPADNMLVEVLTEVSARQADGSPYEYFRALEISRLEDDARRLEQNLTRMRLFQESSL